MRARTIGMAILLGVVGLGTLAPAARADHYVRYYGIQYWRGRDPGEVHRREIVRDRMIDLGDRVELARRDGLINRHDAGRLFEKLDDVRDFLRHDRYLDRDEFDRRMHDLNRVEDRLHDAERHRRHRD